MDFRAALQCCFHAVRMICPENDDHDPSWASEKTFEIQHLARCVMTDLDKAKALVFGQVSVPRALPRKVGIAPSL